MNNLIKAAIFDLDGVLVDADAWHFDALNLALKPYNFAISKEQHMAFYKGIPTRVKLEILSLRDGLDRAKHRLISEAKQNYTIQLIEQQCRPRPEKRQLLQALRSQGYKIAVCSNSIRHTLDLMLDRSGLTEFVDLTLSNEDVTHPKPHPEMYLKAFEKLGLSPPECFIVEDSPIGEKAALDSGAHLCAVRDPEEVNLGRVSSTLNSAGRMKIVIPMAGQGKRFAEAGFTFPKPLVDVLGKPMIQCVIENIGPELGHFVFIARLQDYNQYGLKYLLNLISKDCSVVTVDHLTEGAACTVLLAQGEILNHDELLLANSDQIVDYDLKSFIEDMRNRKADGGMLTFEATHPKWSYALTKGDGQVIEVAEKKVISKHATVGVYYFRRGCDFVHYAKQMIAKDLRINNEFYVCPVFNEFIAGGKSIFIHEIPASKMHGLGTPEDLNTYLQHAESKSLSSVPGTNPGSLG